MNLRHLWPLLALTAAAFAQTQQQGDEHMQHQHAPPPAQQQPKPEQQKKQEEPPRKQPEPQPGAQEPQHQHEAMPGMQMTEKPAREPHRMASGTARYFEAGFTTLLILAVLMVLKPIEKRFFKRPNEAQVSMIIPRGESDVEQVRAALRAIGAFAMSFRIHELNETDDRLEIDVGLPADRTTSELLRQLRSIEGARQILISRELIEDRVRAGN